MSDSGNSFMNVDQGSHGYDAWEAQPSASLEASVSEIPSTSKGAPARSIPRSAHPSVISESRQESTRQDEFLRYRGINHDLGTLSPTTGVFVTVPGVDLCRWATQEALTELVCQMGDLVCRETKKLRDAP